nr:unnamed protein product [Digitaria exilis]
MPQHPGVRSSICTSVDATKQIKFLSYNVWSREDIFVYKRTLAIGALVKKHDPDVIFFQEVTPYIRSIFEDLEWWNKYHCSPAPPEEQPFCLLLSKLPLEKFARWKFANSPMGRCYLEADINPSGPAPVATMKPIRVAITQLERASPPAPMRCVERYAQAEHAVAALSSAENVVFGGDMCWCVGTDRPFPLPAGWVDAWPAWMQWHGAQQQGRDRGFGPTQLLDLR